jgi:hypothetical protein
MRITDRGLTSLGWLHAVVSRDGQAERRVGLLVAALMGVSAGITFLISVTPTPLELSFEDLREGRYRDRTSWLRLEGDLRPAGESSQGELLYTLHDPADDAAAVTIIASGRLPTGHLDVTGRPLGGIRLPGTFEAVYADVPTEPARRDPWPLILSPAGLAFVLLLGARIGYPVMRRERAKGPRVTVPGPDEPTAARWNGRIGGDDLPSGEGRTCTVTVARELDKTMLSIDDGIVRRVVVAHASPKVVGRVCRIDGCRPAVEVHAPSADLILEFGSVIDRDRVAAAVS